MTSNHSHNPETAEVSVGQESISHRHNEVGSTLPRVLENRGDDYPK